MKERWHAVRDYLAAVLIFTGSRLVVLLAIFFAATYVPQKNEEGLWNVNSSWYHYLLRYDSGWYLRIATRGYTYDGNDLIEQPVVFFPLYPLLSRAVEVLFGAPEASVLIVSNISIVIAALLFFKLIKEEYDSRVAFYALTFLCFFPTALFFSAGYTESLTFLLIVGFFLALKRERFLLAAACASLAIATRFTSLVLLLPLLWELWRKFAPDWKRLLWLTAIYSIVATSGLWLYMIFLWTTFNKPLAFMAGLRAWQGGSAGGNIFRALTLQPFAYLAGIWKAGPNPNTLDPWFFLLFLFLIIIYRKRLPTPYLLYGLAALLLPYITRTGGTLEFQSMTRYIQLVFPVFVIMAELCKRRLWLCLSIAGLFAALLFIYTAMFAQWYWVG